jgi:hypothetical protein
LLELPLLGILAFMLETDESFSQIVLSTILALYGADVLVLFSFVSLHDLIAAETGDVLEFTLASVDLHVRVQQHQGAFLVLARSTLIRTNHQMRIEGIIIHTFLTSIRAFEDQLAQVSSVEEVDPGISVGFENKRTILRTGVSV